MRTRGSSEVRGRRMAASIALAGVAAVAAPVAMVATAPAAAATNWYSDGTSYGQLYSAYNCENYLCIWSWKDVEMRAEVDMWGTGPFTFFQDRFYTVVYNVGSASPTGGCIYFGDNWVEHGDPSPPYAAHYGGSVWPFYYSSLNIMSSYYTSSYKETPIADPHFVHRTNLYNFAMICPIAGVGQFRMETYK